jgi:Transcription factor TFIID (or TATA-binding protein, TBP)
MFKITNVKLSLKVSFNRLDTVSDVLKTENITCKSYNNFIVFKNKFTYILFKSKNNQHNHLNVTNIPNFEEIDQAVNSYKNITNSSVISQTVDNITASFSLKNKFNFLEIVEKFSDIAKVTYNSEKFPGIFIKFDKGTVIVFHTGKCIIIGCKSIENLEWLVSKIHVHI